MKSIDFKNRKIIIYGYGKGFFKLIKSNLMQIEVANIIAIVDKNRCEGRIYLERKKDIPLIAPEDIELYTYDYILISSTKYSNEILEELLSRNICRNKILCMKDLENRIWCDYWDKYKKIIGWGTGIYYKRYYREFLDKLSFLIDSKPELEGTYEDGMRIYAPSQLEHEIPEECLIVVFADAFEEISKIAISHGRYDIIDGKLLDLLKLDLCCSKENIKIQQEKLILSISGVDAVYGQNGCRKYIDHQNEILHVHGYDILQVTPLKIHLQKKPGEYVVSLRYNGVELGSVSLEVLFQQVQEVKGMIIHSVYYFYSILEELTKQIHITGNILYYLHDYYCICRNRFLYNPQAETLCTEYEQIANCVNCYMYEKRVAINIFHQGFFESYHVKLIAPSQTTRDIVQKIYTETPIKIIPYLKYDLIEKETTSKHATLRIGFIGEALTLKGWNEFKYIVNELHDEYEFYCLGICDEKDRVDFVHYIDVFLESSDGKLNMVDALNKYEIDIAFLGSICRETYSYTYYEASEAGTYVITTKGSGNISDQVINNHNGRTFESFEEMLEWFKHKKMVLEELIKPRNRIFNIRYDDSFLNLL